jgi:hypothetical protein
MLATTLEEDGGRMTVEVEHSCLSSVAVRQMAAGEQFDVAVRTKQSRAIEFPDADKIVPVGIHRWLLNVYGGPNSGTVGGGFQQWGH